jgi:hypothetical protein
MALNSHFFHIKLANTIFLQRSVGILQAQVCSFFSHQPCDRDISHYTSRGLFVLQTEERSQLAFAAAATD